MIVRETGPWSPQHPVLQQDSGILLFGQATHTVRNWDMTRDSASSWRKPSIIMTGPCRLSVYRYYRLWDKINSWLGTGCHSQVGTGFLCKLHIEFSLVCNRAGNLSLQMFCSFVNGAFFNDLIWTTMYCSVKKNKRLLWGIISSAWRVHNLEGCLWQCVVSSEMRWSLCNSLRVRGNSLQ